MRDRDIILKDIDDLYSKLSVLYNEFYDGDNQILRITEQFKEIVCHNIQNTQDVFIGGEFVLSEIPVALENCRCCTLFFASGASRLNDRITAPVGYIGETLEILTNVIILKDINNKDDDKTIDEKSAIVRDKMRDIIAASKRIGTTHVRGLHTTKDARIRRTIPFRERMNRRDNGIDRELLLFIVEIDYIYRK